MSTWFTSDPHFGHQNIIKYCKRPWKYADEMDEALITNYNSVFTDQDTVYWLGDFAWKQDPRVYLSRLKGKEHHLIIGNHDNRQLCVKAFSSVRDVCMVKIDGRRLWLSHYAHRVWPGSGYDTLHLFGHSHGTLPVIPWKEHLLDAGVDNCGFMPLSEKRVFQIFQTP